MSALPALCAADLHDIDGEVRIVDLRLGERAQLSRSRDIRPVIKNNEAELRRYGSLRVRTAVIEAGKGARHEVEEYWLNEGQALLLLTKLNTEFAADARQEIIEVFMSWRQGRLQPRSDAPVIITKAAVEEILGHLGEHGRATGDLQEGQRRLEGKVDNVVELVSQKPWRRKPRFSKITKEMWRRVILLDYCGFDPSDSDQKILDDEGKFLPNVEMDHMNDEKNSWLDGWPVPRFRNVEMQVDAVREHFRYSFWAVFIARLKKRFPEGKIPKEPKPSKPLAPMPLFDGLAP